MAPQVQYDRQRSQAHLKPMAKLKYAVDQALNAQQAYMLLPEISFEKKKTRLDNSL